MTRFPALLLAFLAAARLGAQELVFMPGADAARFLAEPDTFTRQLSPFDRASRMRTNGVVGDGEFRAFAGREARDWSPAEEAKVTRAYDALRPALARLKVPLPERLRLVRTTGREEGDAAYTRGEVIILPARRVAGAEAALTPLLAHELFHVISRGNPGLRDRLYAVVGFEPCGEVAHPEGLRDRRITNPDAPVNAHAIRIEVDGQPAWGVPILYSGVAAFDPSRMQGFFEVMRFEFLLVERTGAGGHRLLQDGGAPRLVAPDKAKGFQARIGANTGYVIHPEEIVADNFMLLVTGAGNVRSPEILEGIRRELEKR